MSPTSRHRVISGVLVALLLGIISGLAGISGVGCQQYERDEKFTYTITHTSEFPPASVIAAVDDTIKALQLKVQSRSLTNIDAQFWVKSALGTEYQIVVRGVTTQRTKIDIHMPGWRNREQGGLIMSEIRSNLSRMRHEPLGNTSPGTGSGGARYR